MNMKFLILSERQTSSWSVKYSFLKHKAVSMKHPWKVAQKNLQILTDHAGKKLKIKASVGTKVDGGKLVWHRDSLYGVARGGVRKLEWNSLASSCPSRTNLHRVARGGVRKLEWNNLASSCPSRTLNKRYLPVEEKKKFKKHFWYFFIFVKHYHTPSHNNYRLKSRTLAHDVLSVLW